MTVALPPEPRVLGVINWLGLWTLYVKEVRRFGKVATQTVIAPVVTTLLFLAIFALALGGNSRQAGGVSFSQFLAPGLIMMAIVQNAFVNTSSSILISKIQGNIVDLLMPPLSAGELTLAFAAGGVTRGLVVGLAVSVTMAFFVPVHVADPGLVVFHALAASLMLSLVGIVAGVWAEKFDHMAAITNFVITPFAFLSGTFYSVERLPEFWRIAAHFDPFFYMIDGFRAGFIGHADASPYLGATVLICADVLLWIVAYVLFRRGYRLKA
jgi:ABC-2 type transport system permease protein